MIDDSRPLLVFFWSERSGPARRMESLLAHLARKERARLRVRRVDVDANPEIAERFKVETIPVAITFTERLEMNLIIHGKVESTRDRRYETTN